MRNLILGTDWWSDCDDAVALRLLLRAHKNNQVNLLGIIINACMKDSYASIKAFIDSEGVSDILIGIDKDATDYVGPLTYQQRLAKQLPTITNSNAEDGTRQYRKLLASSTEKVEIVEIGFLQVVRDLLLSKPDDISPKTGIELFNEKIEKVWIMGGKWDKDGEKENNFCQTLRASKGASEFLKLCPTPITFLGFEIGYGVITGSNLKNGDILRQVLLDHGSNNGRHSWDPMLVLMAIIGSEEDAGYDTVLGTASVDAKSGANYFIKSESGKHRYVIKKHPNSYYEEIINKLIY